MNFNIIKKNLSKTYDDLADYWGWDKTLHDWGEDDIEKLAKQIGKDGKVLDLGCASGYQSKILSDLGLDVTGLDLSRAMISAAANRIPEAEFVVGDMTNMKFKANTFDGVYSRASILHIPKKLVPKVFKSISKILKGNGIFYLAIKEGEFEGQVEDERHGMKVNRFFSFFKEKEIEKLVESAGFKIESIDKYKRQGGSTVWLKIFARKI